MVTITLNIFEYISRKLWIWPFLKYRVHRNLKVAKKKKENEEKKTELKS